MPDILIIDDEASIQEALSGVLADEGYSALLAGSAEEGIEILQREKVDLVLLDIWMPGIDGLEALVRIKEMQPQLPVVMISGHGTIETAVQATKNGAYDFIEKPLSYDKIILAIKNGLHLSNLEEENRILRKQTQSGKSLTGVSAAIEKLRSQIDRVAPTDAWVLIRGEHGTGKELVARTIHRLSARNKKPLVDVNCAAIPEELIESELFGHEKGAFTGAQSSKRGKFDMADGGVLFLDEIGDMSLKTQAKILRILQEQTFERVGGNRTLTVDVRVLAATNKDLEEEIEAGNFRADLFWRLNVVPMQVPPLRERLEDISFLVEDFVRMFVEKGLDDKTFTQGAMTSLARHPWPGNIRELRNFVERLVIMYQDREITEETVQLYLHPGSDQPPVETAGLSFRLDNFKEAKKEFEREYLRTKLDQNEGNVSHTADQVGIERSHLHKKMKSLKIINE